MHGTPILSTRPLKNVRHTGTLMVRLANRYANDVAPFAHHTPQEMFDLLKRVPYNRDPVGREFLQRPYFTLRGESPGGDCDDKAIVAGAYCILHGWPFKFQAMGKFSDKPFHHVATDILLNGDWVHFDPTYSHQLFGKYLFPPARKMTIGAWNGNYIGP